WQAKVIGQQSTQPPGTILQADKHGLTIATAEGCLQITHLQLPGKKAMTVQEILNARQDWFTVGRQLDESFMKKKYNLRAITATLLLQVLEQGQSLSQLLPLQQAQLSSQDRALLQELCYGILRKLPLLDYYLQQLMQKPFQGKQRILHYLILTGLYQLAYTRIAQHAAVAETVN